MGIIVQKPTFDTSVLKPGKAVHITINGSKSYDRSYNAIITESDPLKVRVMFYRQSDMREDSNTITIESVVSKAVTIQLMEVKREPEETEALHPGATDNQKHQPFEL